MKPFPHQQRLVDNNPDHALLCWEGGTGKTVGAALWLKQENSHGVRRDTNAFVICPKRVVKKWEEELEKWGTKATVLSKEQFKKQELIEFNGMTGLILDEADEFAAPLFIAKRRSQLAAHTYETIKLYRPNVLLLSATPIRSTPWNLHTLLTYMGHYIEWKKWREAFFELRKPVYMKRMAWMPKDDWRKRIGQTLEKYADIVLLSDCVDNVPRVTERTISYQTKPKYVRLPEHNPFHDEHRHEQLQKLKYVKDCARPYRKVIVVAYYREQVEYLAKQLSKERETFMVHGSIKDQETILREANESDECYLVIQASLGSAFDADTFNAVIFASMSFAVRDYAQMKYRVRRIHNLHPVTYYYLHGGRRDKQVYGNISKGKDFVPSEWEDV